MGDYAKTRMGIDGSGYGARIEALVSSVVSKSAQMPGAGMTPGDWLSLAWACVDQAGTHQNVRLTQKAHAAIEDVFDAEPPTLRTGEEP